MRFADLEPTTEVMLTTDRAPRSPASPFEGDVGGGQAVRHYDRRRYAIGDAIPSVMQERTRTADGQVAVPGEQQKGRTLRYAGDDIKPERGGLPARPGRASRGAWA